MLKQSLDLLEGRSPLFEAGFVAEHALAFADIMLPVRKQGERRWKMIEVKSSTTVKDYHIDDVAIQAYIALRAGVNLDSIKLACVDSNWIYRGGDQYKGLLVETDLTEEAMAREGEVSTWIEEAQKVAARKRMPSLKTGDHCLKPFDCGFYEYCRSNVSAVEFPAIWLPHVKKKQPKELLENDQLDMRSVPDALLNSIQQRVKQCTLSGKSFFDSKEAAKVLEGYKLPAYFLDFETVQFAVPIWKNTRPYQKIPFQFSLHRLSKKRKLEHVEFIDLSGKDPSKKFAEALISVCGKRGPIFVYNANFEKARIAELEKRFPKISLELSAISNRIVDLHPIAAKYYYHPSQRGSWSIKSILPTIVPALDYQTLDGVQDGSSAIDAYLEAIHTSTLNDRRAEIVAQLSAYCQLDTLALVHLWHFFSGFESCGGSNGKAF
ncbi:MAG: DUF2779 domain-containing protein [Pseudomonadota bacterium]